MDSKSVWVEVFKAALPVYGLDKSASVANSAVDAFEKRFSATPTKPEDQKTPVAVAAVK
jgi:hypothetical protein